MGEVDEGWVDSLRGEHESDKEWTIKRSFIMAHFDKYEQSRLLCLANCFINMEMYGCGYPQQVMNEVNGLAAQLEELAEYRQEKREREANRIKFVQASSVVETNKRKSEDVTSPTAKSKFPTFVSAGNMKSLKHENSQLETKGDFEMDCGEGTSHAPPSKINNSPKAPIGFDLRAKLNANATSKPSQTFGTLKVTISNTDDEVRVCGNRLIFDSSNEAVDEEVVRVSVPKPTMLSEYERVYPEVAPLIKLHIENLHSLMLLNSPDPSNALVLIWSTQSNSMLFNSLTSYGNYFVDSRVCKDRYELTIGSSAVASVSVEELSQMLINVDAGKTRIKRAAALMAHKVLEYLLPRSWLLIRKNLSEASKAVSAELVQDTAEHAKPPPKALAMLKALGWSEGSGLGSQGQGIKQPITVETTINRQGLGFENGEKNLKKWAENLFSSYIQDDRTDVLVFSSEFTSEDRKVLHHIAQRFRLKSQSRGKGDKRCLTVVRKGLTIGVQIKQLVDMGVYDSDWCTIVPFGTKIIWAEPCAFT